ncbi:MAG: ArnT family glycosyltransferase [Mariniblastus sp.]
MDETRTEKENTFAANPFTKRDWLNVFVLIAIVAAIFSWRLADRPLIGEETRYGTAAREMIASGDWLVFRQQDQIFAERPPVTVWTVAIAGLLRGEVDVFAVRITSVLATVMTCILLYFYVRSFATAFAAFAAGLIFATMGQVLQIGRLGESEPFFALLLSASFLTWHLGYLKRWPALLTWSIGFGLAAIAALVKGPQAPVYFVAITGLYLLVQRDWRFLVSWQTVAGGVVFAAIIAAWQVPYFLVTDLDSVVATWTGLAKDRIRSDGLFAHMAKFPIETLICLLPWSPLLLGLIHRQTRERLSVYSPVVCFLVVALIATYPTVLFAVGARGRYFLPLYPCFAALIALLVDQWSSAESKSIARRNWSSYVLGIGTFICVGGLFFLAGGIGLIQNSILESLHQPPFFAVTFGLTCLVTSCICFFDFRTEGTTYRTASVVSIGLVFGMIASGALINANTKTWNDPTAQIQDLKSQFPIPEKMVSLGPIDHRFAFYYESPIEQLPWPTAQTPLPNNVEYFVFTRRPQDTPKERAAGRGRSWFVTPGTVPFEWEELATINSNRVIREHPRCVIVLGRKIRPSRTAVDVTQPRPVIR